MPIDFSRAHLPALLSWARARFTGALRTETPFTGGREFTAEALDPDKPDLTVPTDFFAVDRQKDSSLFVFLALDPEIEEQGGGPDWEGALGLLITQQGPDAFRLHTVEAWGDSDTFEILALDGVGETGTTMRSCIELHETNHGRFTRLKRELAQLLAAPPVELKDRLPDEPEDRFARIQRLLIEADMREPKAGMWGIESFSDAPAPFGGGMGGFLWFEDWNAMISFARDCFAFIRPGPSRVDEDARALCVRSIVDQVADAAISMDAGRESINAALTMASHIRWWGTFDDLLSGEKDFAREIRASWRECAWDEDDDDAAEPESWSDAPIQPADVPAFLEFLQHWGI